MRLVWTSASFIVPWGGTDQDHCNFYSISLAGKQMILLASPTAEFRLDRPTT